MGGGGVGVVTLGGAHQKEISTGEASRFCLKESAERGFRNKKANEKRKRKRNWKKNILLSEVVVVVADLLFSIHLFFTSYSASYYILRRGTLT
jgi:hypothetical protein